ncbi:MAG: sensor histidine kinase [Candidatus Dormibacteria bacterium]
MGKVAVRRQDVLIAAAVMVLGQQEVWVPGLGFSHPIGPRLPLAITFAITAAALVWRRQAPLLVVLVVSTTLSVHFLVFGSTNVPANFVPPLLAFYAAGRYGTLPTFWAALAITAAGTAVHEFRDPRFSFEGRTVMFWAILLSGGILGWIFKSRAIALDVVAERARQLESGREEQAQAAAKEERARIARELHDLVGHAISLMVLQVVAAQGSLEKGRLDATQAGLARLETTARGTLAEMRRLVSVSGDGEASLAPQPGVADIEALVEQVRADGVSVDLDLRGAPKEAGGGVSLAVYRLVQEALTNVMKHARPASAGVVVALQGEMLTVEVIDRGLGPVGDLGGGRGLAGMRERVELYGGTLQVGPRPEGGFGVRACFPLGATSP